MVSKRRCVQEERATTQAKVANLLTPGNHDPWLDVRDALNGFLFGWARYFSYGTHRAAFRGIDSTERAVPEPPLVAVRRSR